MRACSRPADVSINTVTKLLVDMGWFCVDYHDVMVRDVKAKRVLVDEIWAFCAAKKRKTSTA